MSAGLTLTKAALDSTMGEIAKRVNEVMDEVRQMQDWLEGKVDADLQTEYGYTAGDVANFKTAFADLDELRRIYEGQATLAAVKDFRVFASRIWGLGF